MPTPTVVVEEMKREQPTLFSDNLPHNTTSRDLCNLFYKQGHIEDAYVPYVQNRGQMGDSGSSKFSWSSRERIIQTTNGRLKGQKQILVQWARYPKRYRRIPTSGWNQLRDMKRAMRACRPIQNDRSSMRGQEGRRDEKRFTWEGGRNKGKRAQ